MRRINAEQSPEKVREELGEREKKHFGEDIQGCEGVNRRSSLLGAVPFDSEMSGMERCGEAGDAATPQTRFLAN